MYIFRKTKRGDPHTVLSSMDTVSIGNDYTFPSHWNHFWQDLLFKKGFLRICPWMFVSGSLDSRLWSSYLINSSCYGNRNYWASPTVNIDNRMRQLVNQLGFFFYILQEQPNNCGYFCCELKRNCLSNVMVLVRQEKLVERFCFQLRKLELELVVNRGAVVNQVFTE